MGVGLSKEEPNHKNIAEDEFSYEGLCMSSGGYRGLGMLGSLVVLDMKGYLRNVKYFSGCSVGSVIMLLYACGWKPIELYMKSVTVRIFNGLSDLNLKQFKSKFGLISNDMIRKELESLVLEKRKKIPTLLELYNEGYYLAFSVADRRSKQGIKIDYISDPTLLGTEACLMSSNIPFIFAPIEYKGMKISDGALTNPFPLDYIDNGKRRILGMVVYEKETNDASFINYLTETIMIQIEQAQRNMTKGASDMVDVLELKVNDLGMFSGGGLSYKPRNRIFFSGMRDGKLLVKAIDKRHKKEMRHSNATKENLSQQEALPQKDPPIQRDHRLPKAKTKTDVRHVPDEIVVKCLLSQPVDVLCQAAKVSKSTIDRCFKLLSVDKQDRLKVLARELVKEEMAAGVRVVKEEAPDPRYESHTNVKIKENYTQKLYDNLPTQIKAAARVMVDSMPKSQADRTIGGINIILEGLNRIGIDVFGGLLMGPTNADESQEQARKNRNKYPLEEVNADRIEVLPDEPKKNTLDEVD